MHVWRYFGDWRRVLCVVGRWGLGVLGAAAVQVRWDHAVHLPPAAGPGGVSLRTCVGVLCLPFANPPHGPDVLWGASQHCTCAIVNVHVFYKERLFHNHFVAWMGHSVLIAVLQSNAHVGVVGVALSRAPKYCNGFNKQKERGQAGREFAG